VAVEGLRGGANGVAFLVSAGVVYEIMAACASSPQTAEININRRGGTLMKWVHVGVAQAALFVAIASYVEPQRRTAILMGGILAGLILEGSYLYAKRSGQENPGLGTEFPS
jgi:hypothetical protein